jgi:hypothetical protein
MGIVVAGSWGKVEGAAILSPCFSATSPWILPRPSRHHGGGKQWQTFTMLFRHVTMDSVTTFKASWWQETVAE